MAQNLRPRTIPQRFFSKPGGANRVGRIFIDCLRNGCADHGRCQQTLTRDMKLPE